MKVRGFWSSCWGLPMLQLTTSLNGSEAPSPRSSLTRSSSARSGIAPRTAYSAWITAGLIVLRVRTGARERAAVVDMGETGGVMGLVAIETDGDGLGEPRKGESERVRIDDVSIGPFIESAS